MRLKNDSDKLYRHELKFVLNYADAEMIRARVACVCLPDDYADEDGTYNIKSVYFDTIDDRFLLDTLNGVNVRHKYRIRTYGNKGTFMRLEKKSTEGGLKHKDSDILLPQQAQILIEDNISACNNAGQPVLQEFQAEHLFSFLRPSVVIAYNRVPYVYPLGNVRVTFDSYILASESVDFFYNDSCGLEKDILPGRVILEVKYDDMLPNVIRQIINRSGLLNQTAFSKYAISRTVINGDVY